MHGTVYPPIEEYYYVNNYYLKIDAYENTEQSLRFSELTVLCFMADHKIQKIPIQAKDVFRSSGRELSVSFSLEIVKSQSVGFCIATD